MLVLHNGKKIELDYKGNVSGLLKKLNLRREECIVRINGKVVSDEEDIGEKDTVEVIKVVFGG